MGFMRIVVHRPGAYNPNVLGNMVRRVTKVTARPMSVGGGSLKVRGGLALRDAMGRKLGGGRFPSPTGIEPCRCGLVRVPFLKTSAP